jgi:hypothetical protein
MFLVKEILLSSRSPPSGRPLGPSGSLFGDYVSEQDLEPS